MYLSDVLLSLRSLLLLPLTIPTISLLFCVLVRVRTCSGSSFHPLLRHLASSLHPNNTWKTPPMISHDHPPPANSDPDIRNGNRSLFYLLSNNHVNDMIMFDFRLEDEEVLSHFASFLKTLSLRLNENTVQVNKKRCDTVADRKIVFRRAPEQMGKKKKKKKKRAPYRGRCFFHVSLWCFEKWRFYSMPRVPEPKLLLDLALPSLLTLLPCPP